MNDFPILRHFPPNATLLDGTDSMQQRRFVELSLSSNASSVGIIPRTVALVLLVATVVVAMACHMSPNLESWSPLIDGKKSMHVSNVFFFIPGIVILKG